MSTSKSLTLTKQKKISIFDSEFYYNQSKLPSWKAMKISSFYKQQGYIVNLYTQDFKITYDYDAAFVIKERIDTKMPPSRLLDDGRTILMGKALEGYEGYKTFPMEMSVVRPDYRLFSVKKESILDRIQYVQFYCGLYEIEKSQDWHNTYLGSKISIVVDDNFWDFKSSELIISKLKILQKEPRVGFLHPIKLKKILKDKAIADEFYKLKFSFRYHNTFDISGIEQTYENVVEIIDFIANWNRFSGSFKPIRIRTITTKHWNNQENIDYDLRRCIKIVAYAKSKGVRINLRNPNRQTYSPEWRMFNVLKCWCNNFPNKSFVETMFIWSTEKTNLSAWEISSNSKYWISVWLRYLINLIQTDEEFVKKYCFIEWENKSFPIENVNIDYIKESTDENIVLWLRNNRN